MAGDTAKHSHHVKRKLSSTGESDYDGGCEHKLVDDGVDDPDDFTGYVTEDEEDAVMRAAKAPHPSLSEEKAKPIAADSDVVMDGPAADTLRCPRCNTFKPTTAFADEMLHVKNGSLRACLVCAAMTSAERIVVAAAVEQKDEQQCGRCRVTRPLTEFRKFRNGAGSGVRVVTTCNVCIKAAGDVKERQCTTCKKVKLLGEFEVSATGKYGVAATCKVCRKEA